MFKHYLVSALRNFRRFKTATIINVAGLALGLACFIAAYGAITYFQSGDRHFKYADRIVVIGERVRASVMKFDTGLMIASSPPVAKYLRLDFPQLQAVARLTPLKEVAVGAGERVALLKGIAVDAEFLTMFDLPFIRASAANPLIEPRGVVLSEGAAIKLFGRTDVLGRRVSLQSALDVSVTGVIRAIPQPSHLSTHGESPVDFDIAMTRDTYLAVETNRRGASPPEMPEADQWGQTSGLAYALLPSDGSLTIDRLNFGLSDFARRHASIERNAMDIQYQAIPVSKIALAKLDADLFRGNGLSVVWIVLSLAVMVLGIACVNYANLTIAQALMRRRELGMRRVLGATRLQVTVQYLVESALQILVAFVLAIAIVALAVLVVRPLGSELLGSTVATSFNFWGVVVLAMAVIALGLAFYTALIALRTYPVSALRGSTIRSGSGFAARLLIGFQFAVASLLLIGLAVVQRQNSELRNTGLHASSDPVVVLGGGWRFSKIRYETLRDELLRSSAIKAVSATSTTPWTPYGAVSNYSRSPEATQVSTIVTHVDYGFEKVLDMRVMAGRSFDRAFNDEEQRSSVEDSASRGHVIVIDRSMAIELGWSNPIEAADQVIQLPNRGGGGRSPVRIVGVVENRALRLEAPGGARSNVYVLSPDTAGNAVVRISKDHVAEGLAAIDAVWKRFVPQVPVQRQFMDELFEQAYQSFGRISLMLTLMTIIGAGIAAMGLFGMAVFIANCRSHEIGVRKTLGASVQHVLVMLLRDFSKPVLIANILIWPLAYIAANRYLSMFVDRIPLTPWPFALSLSLTLVVAWVAVSGQAWRAARVNPANVLRHE